MACRAAIASFAIHAALVIMVGWRFPSAPHAGSGDPGADGTFSNGGSDGFLAVAAPNHAPDPAVVALQPPDPELAAPAVAPLIPIVISTTGISPAFTPPAFMPTAGAAAASNLFRTPSRGNRAATTARVPGSGSGGHGRGNGSTGYMPPQFRLRYKPAYPVEARSQHLEGLVLLLVSVDATGCVTSTRLLSSCGHALLDRAALTAVTSWRFEPARQDGVAVAAQVEVPVRFRFEKHASTLNTVNI